MAGTASISWITSTNPSGPQIFTSDTKAQAGISNHVMTGVPAGALLILALAGANDTNNATVGDNLGVQLSWVKKADAQATSSGDAEIWAAYFPAGGNITVSGTISADKQATVLYVITGMEASITTTAVTATGQAQPSVAVTTNQTNSLIICVTSDFHASDGASRVYRDSATEVFYHFDAVNMTGYHYYKQATSITAYTEGLTAPATMQAGTCALEIRST